MSDWKLEIETRTTVDAEGTKSKDVAVLHLDGVTAQQAPDHCIQLTSDEWTHALTIEQIAKLHEFATGKLVPDLTPAAEPSAPRCTRRALHEVMAGLAQAELLPASVEFIAVKGAWTERQARRNLDAAAKDPKSPVTKAGLFYGWELPDPPPAEDE